ncbi:aspartic proteinase 36-like isoform X2 [Salvia hispanica]|uniref:aspartic proteinase 36-like isoform X2 n=1 Tax=Salvia hispanica TaxID=49212 RepID=UPI002009D841|nr:aspartic proteinase 36-like isoform X2 [Salvia hispanica]
MDGRVFYVAAAVVALAAAAASAANDAVGFQRVLSLERAFPVKEDLEVSKARDRARRGRMLQSYSGGIVDFTVDGTSDPYAVGLYYTKVRLGTPPQEFNVQIDTGSDILWVTCSSCNDCPQNSGLGIPLNFFNGASSSTFSPMSCSDSICASIVQTASAECNSGSNQFMDASLIVNSSAPIVFGCSTSLFGDLTDSDRAVDGIFGFGQNGLSVISQLSSSRITPKVFSHCLKGEGSGGGILVLGEIMDPRIVYTPLVPSQPHYNLHLQSIAVNGQLLPIDQGLFTTSGNRGTIIDSGTTLAYLVEGAYDPLVAAITGSISPSVRPITSKGNQCYLLSTGLAEVFPEVSFNFAGGASMVLRPIDYLVHMGFADGATMWCMGFLKVPNQGTTILGGGCLSISYL